MKLNCVTQIKQAFTYMLITMMLTSITYAQSIGPSCTYKGIPLYGKVKVVNSFEDIKVKKVSSFEDLKVKKVNSFADKCGRWQFVDSFEDFKIKYVDSFEDIKIKYVDSFEGL